MAKTTWQITDYIDRAIAKLQEQRANDKLADWTMQEHLAMARYMALDCYAQAQSKLLKAKEAWAKIQGPDKPKEPTLEEMLKAELRQAFNDGKIAECANMKKALQELDIVPKKTAANLTYE